MGWLCTSNTARSSLVFGPPPPSNRQHHAPPHLYTPHGHLLRLLLLYANIWHIRVLSQESSQLRKPFPSYWKLAFIGLLASFLITFPDSAFLLETSAWKEIFSSKFYQSPDKCNWWECQNRHLVAFKENLLGCTCSSISVWNARSGSNLTTRNIWWGNLQTSLVSSENREVVIFTLILFWLILACPGT